jgi:hypothetical protein
LISWDVTVAFQARLTKSKDKGEKIDGEYLADVGFWSIAILFYYQAWVYLLQASFPQKPKTIGLSIMNNHG